MLDVGFSEILLTSAIALVVLGPERLPKVARQVGNWMGRARAMARQLSEQLEREVTADELLKEQAKASAKKPASGTRTPTDPAIAGATATDASSPVDAPGPVDAAAPAPAAAPSPASRSDLYSPGAAAAPHGADWHVSPPEAKSGNG